MVSGYHRDDKMSLNMYNDLVFKKKSMRIDWRKIAAVDLDRIVRDMDVFALQDNIDHLTFCNIDVELDTRIVDPTYIKLFKMSQYTIEYLMHSQNYLTDVISTIEGQLNKALLETDHYKSSHDKIQKELIDLKKENKKRKKMIETQQGLMNANSSNYHQCAYCSKVFLNISYLQAHITRRHSDVDQLNTNKQNNGIEKELVQIKERLKNTENDLVQERAARLSSMSNLIMPSKTSADSGQNDELLKQMESIKRQKDDFKKTNDRFKAELRELTNKNVEFEKEIKDLQEKLSKKSNVGWMKDDIELQKDSALKQKQEIERLNILLEDYEKQIEELKTKWKSKEANIKKKHLKELNEKEDDIQALKAKLLELQNSIGKTDNELVSRLEQMQINLQQEQKLRYNLELELGELKNRPPPVTPRQNSDLNRSISPAKPIEKPQPPERPEKPEKLEKPTQQKSQLKNIPAETIISAAASIPFHEVIYLTEHCPLTLRAVQKNPDMLRKFKDEAHKVFEDELDQLGIDPSDKTLTKNDYKQKSKSLKVIRKETSEELPIFDEMREVLSNICERYASQKLNVSIRSTGNRVTFKPDLISRDKQLKNHHHNNQAHNQKSPSKHQNNENSLNEKTFPESEETDDDVSLSNALESNDDDTEPTKSLVTETINSVKSTRKQKKTSVSYNQDEISDLESISQLLTDRSGSRRKAISDKTKPLSKVEENKKKIESQLDKAYTKQGKKPSPNAVPIGFQSTASRLNNQESLKNASFSSISDLDNETNKQRPKSGLKSTLSESSSIWVSDTHDSEMPNNQINKNIDVERPPTANSLKTSNFDSDEDTNIN